MTRLVYRIPGNGISGTFFYGAPESDIPALDSLADRSKFLLLPEEDPNDSFVIDGCIATSRAL